MRRVAPFPFAALLALACTPEVGGTCSAGDITCADPQTKLFCKDGKYVAMPCKGKGGCVEKDGELTCDVAGNAEGDVCAKSNEGTGACSPDGKAQVVCLDEKIVIVPCRGEKGCTSDSDGNTCDRSIAKLDERCRDEAAPACSEDKKQMLECKGDKYVVDRACRGEKGCRIEGSQALCDVSIGRVGDKCDDGSACSEDGKEMLRCQDGKLGPSEHCRGPKGCRRQDSRIRCDQTLSSVGDKCRGAGAACSVDGKAILECKDGAFIKGTDCRITDCAIDGTKVTCR